VILLSTHNLVIFLTKNGRAGTPRRRPGDYQFYAHGPDERPVWTMNRKLNILNGSPGRARTADLVINSHPLYQLSYRGIENLQERE
jgi:hypothetical protein